MRAAVCRAFGPPSGVEVVDAPDPVPGAGEVSVAVRAAAVNFPDFLIVAGAYQLKPPLPFTPGSEFAGEVVAVGDGVDTVTVGARVVGTTFTGAFAEQVVVPVSALAPMPAGLDFVEASAYQVAYGTAYHALVTVGEGRPGDDVVVLGAAGGVGLACVDLGVRLGMRVIAAASSADRVRAARDRGAAVGIDYSVEDLKQRVKQVTGGGADVVVDPVGGDLAEAALRATRYGARFVTVGFASGRIPRIPLNLVLLKGAQIRGFELRTIGEHRPDAVAAAARTIDVLLAQGLRPVVSQTRGLSEVAKVLDDVHERRTIGKVVVEPHR